MKQVTISIPDSFYKTFLEFFKHIPDAKIDDVEDFVIPEWQKKETLKRINSSKPEAYIPWDKAKKQLKFKTK